MTGEVGKKIPGDMRELLHTTLDNYKRWLREGKPKYGYNSQGGEQMYHDTYHNHMEGEPDNVLSFHIQIYDSPHGDVWWSGTFRVRPDRTLKVLTTE